jgi:hypothetical protein
MERKLSFLQHSLRTLLAFEQPTLVQNDLYLLAACGRSRAMFGGLWPLARRLCEHIDTLALDATNAIRAGMPTLNLATTSASFSTT